MNVGWIGLGQVGLPMVLALLRGGISVTALTRRPLEHRCVQEAGGELVVNAYEVLEEAEALGISVFDEAQLSEILFGVGGIIGNIAPGTLVFIHSTVSPAFMSTLYQRRPDVAWLDCAFSGTAKDVAAGTLTLMVGGDEGDVERIIPVVRCYAAHIVHVGGLGTGMLVKVVNNALFAANINLAFTAIQALSQAGVAIRNVMAVLEHSSGSSYALSAFSAGDPHGVMQSIERYVRKDLALARATLDGLPINIDPVLKAACPG